MDVFTYGTLTDPARADAVLGEWTYGPDAVLDGLHRVEGEYPTLAPGGTVDGRILRTEEVDALDRYEGVESGLYVRAEVPDVDGGMVAVYVGDPERLDAPASWPATGDFAARVAWYVRKHGVTVRSVDGDRRSDIP